MMLDKIVTYLSRLDGVKVGEVHDSHSQYFQMSDIRVRVSDHFAIKANFPTTLNIVCEGENFVVTYGNKLLPVKNYTALRQLLRNFAMVSDILAPLAETRRKPLIIEKVVEKRVEVVVEKPLESTPTTNPEEWIYIGDLPEERRKGARSVVNNTRKMWAASKKKKQHTKTLYESLIIYSYFMGNVSLAIIR